MKRVAACLTLFCAVGFSEAPHTGLYQSPAKPYTPPALSDHSGANFCTHPYQALCHSPLDTQRRADLNEKAKRLSLDVTNEAKAITTSYLQAHHSLYDLNACPLLPEAPPFPGHKASEQNWEYKNYLQNIFGRLYTKVDEPHEMEAVRKLAEKAVDRLGPALGANPADVAATKKKMKEKLEGITYVTSAAALVKLAEYDPKRAAKGSWDKDLLIEFQRRCGIDGSQQNSYYNATTNAVILCPGMIERAMQDVDPFDDGDPTQMSHSFMTQVLAHETGHALGEGNFPMKYEAWKSCQDPKLHASYPGDSSRYHTELLADHWAAQMLAQQVEVAEPPARAERFLRGAAELYCDLPFKKEEVLEAGEGAHVSGADRIRWSFANNETIRRKLDCAPPSLQHPLCSFSGPITRPTPNPSR